MKINITEKERAEKVRKLIYNQYNRTGHICRVGDNYTNKGTLPVKISTDTICITMDVCLFTDILDWSKNSSFDVCTNRDFLLAGIYGWYFGVPIMVVN